MVYFITWVGFMSQTPITFDFVFSNIHMITPWQDISVKQKCYTKSNNTIPGLDFPFMSRTTTDHVPSVPEPNLCHKPYGLLKQFPIPERPWNYISMDFIEKLFLGLYLDPSCC